MNVRSSIVVFAMGFGIGADLHGPEAAREFFGYSALESDVLTAEHGSNHVVQILGCGDGGLQEALRFALAPEHQDLAEVVAKLEGELQTAHSARWHDLLATLRTAEDQALRSLIWGYSEEVIFEELHHVYERAIGTLLVHCRREVEHWAAKVLRPVGITVEIVARGFSKRVYSLNRFLTMLLAEVPQQGKARLCRVDEAHVTANPDIRLSRKGFAADTKPDALGTANGDDLLQRIAFRGLPMNLDAVR